VKELKLIAKNLARADDECFAELQAEMKTVQAERDKLLKEIESRQVLATPKAILE
jgi:hypothetical protein